jgi:putative membrane protein
MKIRTLKAAFAPAMLALAVAVSPAYAQDDATRPDDDSARLRAQENVARSDTRVNTDAARAGMLNDGQILQIVRTLNDGEIKQANEAKDEGESEAVKQVAEMIITDHEAANDQMDDLLDGPLNLEDSPLSETLGKQAEETHELLQDLSGTEYDCNYLQQQVVQHEAAIQTSRTQLEPNAQDAGVKAFLTAMGPKLEHHLQMAKEALSKMEGCSAPN